MNVPTINDAKRIAYQHRCPGVAILFVKDGQFGLSSYGMTREQCRAMGTVIDRIHDLVQDGTIEIPDCLLGRAPNPLLPLFEQAKRGRDEG